MIIMVTFMIAKNVFYQANQEEIKVSLWGKEKKTNKKLEACSSDEHRYKNP